jgi:hypothetical protein
MMQGYAIKNVLMDILVLGLFAGLIILKDGLVVVWEQLNLHRNVD